MPLNREKIIPTLFNWNAKQSQQFIISCLFFIAAIYFLLHNRYVLYNGDDVWSTSRFYEYMTTGFNRDTFFTTVETANDKTLIFHMLQNKIYGNLLNIFGWTKSNVHLISTLFVGLSAFLWFHILKSLNFSFSLSCVFGLTLMLFPAYFGAADLSRPDALTFFLASSSFLLFIKKRYLFAAFTMLMAMETHAMGMIAGFYILAYVLSEWRYFFNDWKRFLRMALLFGTGVALGVGYYLFLHWDIISWDRFSTILLSNKNVKKELPNYLITYFISPEWYLHVWELFLLLFGIGFYFIKGAFKKNSFVWIFLLSLLISTLISGRPNRFYIIFIFPAFQLLLLYTAEQSNRLKEFTFFLFVVFALNYGALYWQNHSYHFSKISAQITESIPDKNIPVVGMSDTWFAAKKHPFYLIYNSIHDLPEQDLPALYLVETPYLHTSPVSIQLENYILNKGLTKDPLMSKRRVHYDKMIAHFKSTCDCELIKKIPAYRQEYATVSFCKRKQ